MKNQEVIGVLSRLVQMDINTLHTYDRAIPKIKDEIMRERIEGFRADHEGHINVLVEEIQSLGGMPPSRSVDVKGFLMEGFAALVSLVGTRSALKTLKMTEQMTNRRYNESIPLDVPEPVKEILRRHFSDEKIHLEYFISNLQALS